MNMEYPTYNPETGELNQADVQLLLMLYWELTQGLETLTKEFGVIAVATLHNLQKIDGARLFGEALEIMRADGRMADVVPVEPLGVEPADSEAMAVAIDKILRSIQELMLNQKSSELAKKLNGNNLLVASDIVLWVTKNGGRFSYNNSIHMLNLSRQEINKESIEKQRETLKSLYCEGPFTLTYDIAYAATEIVHDNSKKSKNKPYSNSGEIRATGVRLHVSFDPINPEEIDQLFKRIDTRLFHINAGLPFFDLDTPQFRRFIRSVAVEPLKPFVHQKNTRSTDFQPGYLNRNVLGNPESLVRIDVADLSSEEQKTLFEVLSHWVIKAVPPTAPALLWEFNKGSQRAGVVVV